MSNAKTGIWSALGALAGGLAGAAAGKLAVEARPRYRYGYAEQPPRRRPGGSEVEDAMVVGGAAGAVLGAFIGGTMSGEETPPQLPSR
jgi:outer membrane lipoprotein SlyB